MTPSDLKYEVEKGKGSFFFTRETMKFFGDTMKNYGVRKATINTRTELNVPCWELYRKRPVKHGRKDSVYFNFEFNRIFKKERGSK